jgi:hypothetical protein
MTWKVKFYSDCISAIMEKSSPIFRALNTQDASIWGYVGWHLEFQKGSTAGMGHLLRGKEHRRAVIDPAVLRVALPFIL